MLGHSKGPRDISKHLRERDLTNYVGAGFRLVVKMPEFLSLISGSGSHLQHPTHADPGTQVVGLLPLMWETWDSVSCF